MKRKAGATAVPLAVGVVDAPEAVVTTSLCAVTHLPVPECCWMLPPVY